jgi:hypothetical protein
VKGDVSVITFWYDPDMRLRRKKVEVPEPAAPAPPPPPSWTQYGYRPPTREELVDEVEFNRQLSRLWRMVPTAEARPAWILEAEAYLWSLYGDAETARKLLDLASDPNQEWRLPHP